MLPLLLHTPLLLIWLLLLLPASGGSQPAAAQQGPPTPLILEAVKKGILSNLGLEREPRPAIKASQKELKKMFKLYREELSQMRKNSSRSKRESSISTVLFPVEPVQVRRRGDERRILWYRAVFQKVRKIHPELNLDRALVRVSKQGAGRYVSVKINGLKPTNSAKWPHQDSGARSHVSTTQDVTLDITPEAKRNWTDDKPLVVDVRMETVKSDLNPVITLEVDQKESIAARSVRHRRSNKEDNCDEQGLCCRKSVTVSFKDIGWTDWVVAPAEYTMHFCDGTCPHNYKPASMHTQVKSRLHLITKGGMPRPCCVPAAYEPMVLMHYDSRGKLKLTAFHDFIVTKCHCA
ncbi:growth/differentiation factor 15 [Cyprinodon tularosa]|uniref:growth/differentiation factor 15 n=1 Tax=Cyprinodon tularosa TaxID=77115 RepID=UPI0018E1F8D9|nr:growth/differentiation factor 15 [Cyprinodon tularosa]